MSKVGNHRAATSRISGPFRHAGSISFIPHSAFRIPHFRKLWPWLLLLAILSLSACARLETPYLRAQLRFATIDPCVLLVSMPDHVRVSTMHQTLGGASEVAVETKEEPIDLSAVARQWAAPLAATLRFFREVHIAAAEPASGWARRLDRDPRRAGQPGYRLLEPYRPPATARDQLAAPLPSESDLDDPRASRCLVRSLVPADNLPAPLWYDFDAAQIRKHFHAPLLLLVTMDHLTVVDTGGKPAVQYRLSAFLVDLETPLLASVVSIDLDGTRAEGPSGVEAALCPSLAALRADGWAALRQSLLVVSRRYGHILATQWGWVNPDYLAEQVMQWKAENDAQLAP